MIESKELKPGTGRVFKNQPEKDTMEIDFRDEEKLKIAFDSIFRNFKSNNIRRLK